MKVVPISDESHFNAVCNHIKRYEKEGRGGGGAVNRQGHFSRRVERMRNAAVSESFADIVF
ncbi:MAG: hypothetical protein R3C45_14175 [Phycisphaerales bacterium]